MTTLKPPGGPLFDGGRPLILADMERAMDMIRDAPAPVPHQHLTSPAAVEAGRTAERQGRPYWVSCADCGEPINLGASSATTKEQQ